MNLGPRIHHDEGHKQGRIQATSICYPLRYPEGIKAPTERPFMIVSNDFFGAPGEIRTPGLLIRSQTLYPTELRAHEGNVEDS